MNSTTKIWAKPMLAGTGVLLGLFAWFLFLWGFGGDHGCEDEVLIDEAEDAGIAHASAEEPLVEDPLVRGTLLPFRSSDREQLLVESDRRGDEASGEPSGEAEAKAVLTGRCVAAEDGRPLANCEIYLCGLSLGGVPEPGWEGAPAPTEVSRRDLDWYAIARRLKPGNSLIEAIPSSILSRERGPIHLDRLFLSHKQLKDLREKGLFYQRRPNAVTDAQGRFRIEFWAGKHPYGPMWSLYTSSPMRLPVGFQMGWFEGGEAIDLGTLRLPRGVRISGRVVGREGKGLSHATVRIHGLPNQIPGRKARLVYKECEKDGGFAFSLPIPNGRWKLTVEGDGIVSYSEWIVVNGRAQDRTIVVEERPTISGRILLPSGSPATQIEVLAISSDREVQGKGVSDAAGRFVIRATGKSLPPVRLCTGSPSKELLHAPRSVRWGSHGLHLKVASISHKSTAAATPPLFLLLRDSVTGEDISGQFDIPARPTWAKRVERDTHRMEVDR